MVKRDGKPFLAFSSMASGLHHKTVQSLINALDFGMEPKAASDAPSLLFSAMVGGFAGMGEMRTRVLRGQFGDELFDQTGLEVEQVDVDQLRLTQGIWVGLQKSADRSLKANAPL